MLSVLLGVHFVLALAIIGLVLLQKHDSDGALGSSGGGAASGMFSVRGQANLLTRSTAWLMAFFMINCLVMAKITKNTPSTKKSVIDRVAEGSVLPIEPKKDDAEKKSSAPSSDLSKLKGPDGKPMPTPPSDLSKLKKPNQSQPAPAKPAKPTNTNPKNPSKK